MKIVLKPEKEFDREFKTRVNAVRAIAAYGDAAIPALIQITEESTIDFVKERALEEISRIKTKRSW